MKGGSAKGAVAEGGTCCARDPLCRVQDAWGEQDIGRERHPTRSRSIPPVPRNPTYPTESHLSHLIPANPARTCRVGRHARAPGETGDAGRLPPLRSPVGCGRAVPDTRAGAGCESPMSVAAANPQLLGTEQTFLPATICAWIAASPCRQARRSERRRAAARMEDPDAVEDLPRPDRFRQSLGRTCIPSRSGASPGARLPRLRAARARGTAPAPAPGDRNGGSLPASRRRRAKSKGAAGARNQSTSAR